MHEDNAPIQPTLAELAWFFLKLGTLAFGGPAAHIAIMHDQLIHRLRWISSDEFLDLLGASNLLPGPSSTELAIYIGYHLKGIPGLLAAGICFILPAALIVSVLAWIYVRYHSLPRVTGVLYGLKPVVIALVLQALVRLGQTALKTRYLTLIGLICIALALIPLNPLAVLCIGGVLSAIARDASPPSAPLPTITFRSAAISTAQIGIASIFGAFLKIGCVVFGSGYVLLAFLQDDLVLKRHWLSSDQLLDAVAIGQATPGPVFTTATFIGYLLGGPRGAAAATAAIFLPAFVLVALTGRFIPRLRASWYAGAFLAGLNVASLALMAAVLAALTHSAIVDTPTAAIAIVSALALLRTSINPTWRVAAAALAGLIRH